MKKNVTEVYRCGGGANDNIVDLIAIKFDDGTTEYMQNDCTVSIKKQVREFIKNKADDSTKQ